MIQNSIVDGINTYKPRKPLNQTMLYQFDLNFDFKKIVDYSVGECIGLGRSLTFTEFKSMFNDGLDNFGVDEQKRNILTEMAHKKDYTIDAQELLMDLGLLATSSKSIKTLRMLQRSNVIVDFNEDRDFYEDECKYIKRGSIIDGIKYNKNTFLLTYDATFKVLVKAYTTEMYAFYYCTMHRISIAFMKIEQDYNKFLISNGSEDADTIIIPQIVEIKKERETKLQQTIGYLTDAETELSTNEPIANSLKETYDENDNIDEETGDIVQERNDYNCDLENKNGELQESIDDICSDLNSMNKKIKKSIRTIIEQNDLLEDIDDEEDNIDINKEYDPNSDLLEEDSDDEYDDYMFT
jgi:hypothetical protein